LLDSFSKGFSQIIGWMGRALVGLGEKYILCSTYDVVRGRHKLSTVVDLY
jgi:hypothetical protein